MFPGPWPSAALYPNAAQSDFSLREDCLPHTFHQQETPYQTRDKKRRWSLDLTIPGWSVWLSHLPSATTCLYWRHARPDGLGVRTTLCFPTTQKSHYSVSPLINWFPLLRRSPNRMPSALTRSFTSTSGIDSSLGGACLEQLQQVWCIFRTSRAHSSMGRGGGKGYQGCIE